MSMTTKDLLKLSREVALRPAMYAGRPQESSGILMAIAWFAIHSATGWPISKCMRYAQELNREVTTDVPHTECQIPSLCDSRSFPKHRSSFAALKSHGKIFADRLEEFVRTA